MNWFIRLLARLTGAVPAAEGIALSVAGRYWVLTARSSTDIAVLLALLREEFAEATTLYVESPAMAGDVQGFFAAKPAAWQQPVMSGTYWPKPRMYHIDFSAENVRGIADLLDRHAEIEVCDRIVVYGADRAYVEAWDLPRGAVLIDQNLDAARVETIARNLDCAFEFVDTAEQSPSTQEAES